MREGVSDCEVTKNISIQSAVNCDLFVNPCLDVRNV